MKSDVAMRYEAGRRGALRYGVMDRAIGGTRTRATALIAPHSSNRASIAGLLLLTR
jgi:hypothetical protein